MSQKKITKKMAYINKKNNNTTKNKKKSDKQKKNNQKYHWQIDNNKTHTKMHT